MVTVRALLREKAAREAAIHSMPTDFRHLTREALVSLEASSMALETLAAHGITESTTFDRVVELVDLALQSVRGIEAALTSTPTTIFPNADLARAWCEQHPLDSGRFYQINRDGVGRCTVSVALVVEHL